MANPLNPVIYRLLEWVLTFTAHSTLFLVLAWIFCRFIAQHNLVLRETVWRAAVLGALFTASIQIMSGISSWKVSIPMAIPENERPLEMVFRHTGAPITDLVTEEHVKSPSSSHFESARGRKSYTPSHGQYLVLVRLVFAVWMAGITIGLLRLIRGARAMSKILRNRITLEPPTELVRLSRILGVKKAPDLTESAGIVSPVVFGIIHSEICLPKGLLQVLPNGERRALLAHETAHIVRRDPLWRVVYRILRAVFFFNPLLVRSLHSLELIAEFLCDQMAAACTGNNIGLARCILQFAQHSKGGPSMSPFTSALSSTSSIGQRIHRLLRQPETNPNRNTALAGVYLVLCLIIATCMFPTISCSRAGQSMKAHGTEIAVQNKEHEGDTADIGSTVVAEEESVGATNVESRYPEGQKGLSDEEAQAFEEEHAALIEEIEEATRKFETEYAEEIRQLEEAAERIAEEQAEQLRLSDEEIRQFEVEHAEEIRQLEEAAEKLAEEHEEHARLAEEAARRFEEEHAEELRRLDEAHDRFKEEYGSDFEQDPELRRRFEEEHAEKMSRLEEAAHEFEIQQSIRVEIQEKIQRRIEEEQAGNIQRLEEAARRLEQDVDRKLEIQQDIQRRLEEEHGEQIRRLEEAVYRFEDKQREKIERLEEAASVYADKQKHKDGEADGIEAESLSSDNELP